MGVKSHMSLKVWSILGTPKKISKSPKVGRFLKIMLKVNLLMGICRFSDNFPKICKLSMFRASEASFASLAQSSRAKRSLSKSRMFRASEASLASLAVFANELKQASQALSTLVKRANQPSYARLHSRLRPPSHTGREEGREEGREHF